MKIAVYTIALNEAAFVEPFCKSAADADLIVIGDTGSTDNTAQEARGYGAIVYPITITPWRFDLARNAVLALIPPDIDVCISLDLDERLEPGWREEIERVWTLGETTQLLYLFDWGAGIRFRYEKIHARAGYHWHHPCHEYPRADGRCPVVWAETGMLLVRHHPDNSKSRGQYLPLLELSVQEDPTCPRNAFYYARELSFAGRWIDSIVECRRYLALPGANWPNERCYAWRVMGDCYQRLGDLGGAERCYIRASHEAPNTREPWCGLAMIYYSTGRWLECFDAATRALAIVDRALVYTQDPAVWGALPHDLASKAAWHLGRRDEALQHAINAAAIEPTDERLAGNVRYCAETLAAA